MKEEKIREFDKALDELRASAMNPGSYNDIDAIIKDIDRIFGGSHVETDPLRQSLIEMLKGTKREMDKDKFAMVLNRLSGNLEDISRGEKDVAIQNVDDITDLRRRDRVMLQYREFKETFKTYQLILEALRYSDFSRIPEEKVERILRDNYTSINRMRKIPGFDLDSLLRQMQKLMPDLEKMEMILGQKRRDLITGIEELRASMNNELINDLEEQQYTEEQEEQEQEEPKQEENEQEKAEVDEEKPDKPSVPYDQAIKIAEEQIDRLQRQINMERSLDGRPDPSLQASLQKAIELKGELYNTYSQGVQQVSQIKQMAIQMMATYDGQREACDLESGNRKVQLALLRGVSVGNLKVNLAFSKKAVESIGSKDEKDNITIMDKDGNVYYVAKKEVKVLKDNGIEPHQFDEEAKKAFEEDKEQEVSPFD